MCVQCIYIVYCSQQCVLKVMLDLELVTGFYASINDVEDYYFMKDELARGRFEVFVDRTYGTILCDDFWDYQEASVVCSQLGFFSHGQ